MHFLVCYSKTLWKPHLQNKFKSMNEYVALKYRKYIFISLKENIYVTTITNWQFTIRKVLTVILTYKIF